MYNDSGRGMRINLSWEKEKRFRTREEQDEFEAQDVQEKKGKLKEVWSDLISLSVSNLSLWCVKTKESMWKQTHGRATSNKQRHVPVKCLSKKENCLKPLAGKPFLLGKSRNQMGRLLQYVFASRWGVGTKYLLFTNVSSKTLTTILVFASRGVWPVEWTDVDGNETMLRDERDNQVLFTAYCKCLAFHNYTSQVPSLMVTVQLQCKWNYCI